MSEPLMAAAKFKQLQEASEYEQWEYWHNHLLGTQSCNDPDYRFEHAVMGEAWMRQQYTTDKLRLRWLKSAVRHTIPVGTATAVKKGPDEWEIEGQGLV